MEKKVDELRKESKSIDERYVATHKQISALQSEAGALLLAEGSDSRAFKELTKRIKEAEENIQNLLRLKVAFENAIKQAERDIRKKEKKNEQS